MDAQQALVISKSNKPLVIDGKYNAIMKSIEEACKKGETSIALGFLPPRNEIIEKLEQHGYWIYSLGDNFLFPNIYGVSWAERPKKKWYQKIFG